jgi:TetR/AcrR family transcriptional repressor of mexJK operon
VGRPVDHAKEVAILDAGRELMFSKGPAKLSMEAVARKAGVSKVTLYNRFPDKSTLIETIIRNIADDLVIRLATPPDRDHDCRQALTEFGLFALNFIVSRNHLNFLRLLGSMPEVDRELMHGIYDCGAQASQMALSRWLSAKHEASELYCTDPDFAAEMFFSMIIGLDIVRALHQVPPRQPNGETAEHVDKVVTKFLSLWGHR